MGETAPPSEVTALSAWSAPGFNSQINISWIDPTDNDFNHAEITWSPGGSTVQNVNKGLLGYSAASLSTGTEYTFTVRTVDNYGNKSQGITVKGVPVNQPVAIGSSSAALLMAADSSNIYWTNYGLSPGAVYKVPNGGGSTTNLTPSLSYPPYPYAIAVDSTNVYFTQFGTGYVSKVPTGGGAVTVLASGLSYPVAIAVDSTNVYWVENGITGNDGAVKTCTINGTGADTIVSVLRYPAAIALDATFVYCIDSIGVHKFNKLNHSYNFLASGSNQFPNTINVDTSYSYVFWLDYGTGSDGAVRKISTGGTGLDTLASGLSYPNSMATDTTYVYWTDRGTGSNGCIKKVNKVSPYTVTIIATGLYYPSSIAVDGTHLYWIESNSVKKVLK